MNLFDFFVFFYFDSVVICMSVCVILVIWYWFRVKGYYDIEIFGDFVQNVFGNLEVVIYGDIFIGVYLEFLLKQKI